jgi:hypothetical protein
MVYRKPLLTLTASLGDIAMLKPHLLLVHSGGVTTPNHTMAALSELLLSCGNNMIPATCNMSSVLQKKVCTPLQVLQPSAPLAYYRIPSSGSDKPREENLENIRPKEPHHTVPLSDAQQFEFENGMPTLRAGINTHRMHFEREAYRSSHSESPCHRLPYNLNTHQGASSSILYPSAQEELL